MIRKTRPVTASELPATGREKTAALLAFELICSVDECVPALGGWNTTWTVHLSPTATVGLTEAQGFAPPLGFKMKLWLAGARNEMAETFNAALPLLLIVTSRGAGAFPAVTLPKSKDAGST